MLKTCLQIRKAVVSEIVRHFLCLWASRPNLLEPPAHRGTHAGIAVAQRRRPTEGEFVVNASRQPRRHRRTADPSFDESLYGSLGKPAEDLLLDQSVQVRLGDFGHSFGESFERLRMGRDTKAGKHLVF